MKVRLPFQLSVTGLILLGTLVVLGATPPPASEFVRRLDINEPELSEDGRYVSFLTPNSQKYYDLNLYDLETNESKKLKLGGDDILGTWWIDKNRLVIYSQNLPSYGYRCQIYNPAGNRIAGNLSFEGQYFQLVSNLRRQPNLFVAYYPVTEGGSRASGLAIINPKAPPTLMGGRIDNSFIVKEWMNLPKGELRGTSVDHNGEVRLVNIFNDGALAFHYRAHSDSNWIKLPLDPLNTNVLGFTSDPDQLYIASYQTGAKTSRLHRYRVSTNEPGPLVFEDTDYSMMDAALFTVRQENGADRVLALDYERDFRVQRAIDPVFAEVQKALNDAFPGRLNIIHDCDWNFHRFLASVANGREPERHLIYDRQTKEIMLLADPAPWIDPAKMSVQRPLKFTTRDGLVLEGYLSLPNPATDGHKPPLVVYVHGGPWLRDIWGYDAEVQFLTSRGYAVFQPNYRGSTGYPKTVSHDESFEFLKMHNDVTDGVRHVMSLGKTDNTRIAIYGGSFGGYLAVCGAAFEPELYRCAITFAGVFDWKKLMRQEWSQSHKFKANYELLIQHLGDPEAEKERFEKMSPLGQIAAIKCAVFVCHGEADDTVDAEQSRSLLRKLSAHHIRHEKLMFGDERHGVSERENRQKFFEALEKFLAKNL